MASKSADVPARSGRRALRLARAERLKLDAPVQSKGQRRAVLFKALDGKEYLVGPLPDDPSEVTFYASLDTIREALEGESQ